MKIINIVYLFICLLCFTAAPALETLTSAIYERTKVIKEIKHVKLLDFDIDSYGVKVLIKEQFMVREEKKIYCMHAFVIILFSNYFFQHHYLSISLLYLLLM